MREREYGKEWREIVERFLVAVAAAAIFTAEAIRLIKKTQIERERERESDSGMERVASLRHFSPRPLRYSICVCVCVCSWNE